MFGFHKKVLSEEEKRQYTFDLHRLIEAKDHSEALKKAKEYEKYEKAAAAFFLAKIYLLGQGIKQDLDKAQIYIEAYTKKYPQDQEGWFLQSSIMLAVGKRDESTECLYRAENLGRTGMDRYIAEYCSFQGMSYYNTACLTLNGGQRAGLYKKAEKYFSSANERYEKIVQGNADCGDGEPQMTENDWTQLGYNLHYLHYIALNANETDKVLDCEKQAETMFALMDQAGYGVRVAYTRAMLAENIANLNNSREALQLARQYLDQAVALAGDKNDQYQDEYELVWKEYDRIFKLQEHTGKKGIFGKRNK